MTDRRSPMSRRAGAHGGASTDAPDVAPSGSAAESTDGRTRLLDTAERMLDEQGLDGPSARAISAAAGHGNTAAVLYHFGSYDGLVEAVLKRRGAEVDARRQAAVDALLAVGHTEPREALRAIVAPVADMLLTTSGRRYLRLMHQAITHPTHFAKVGLTSMPQTMRFAPLIGPTLDRLPPDRRAQRVHALIVSSLTLLATQARLIDAPTPPRPLLPHDEFVEDLVDILVGMLEA